MQGEDPEKVFEPATIEEATVYHEAYRAGRDMWDRHIGLEKAKAEQRAIRAETELNIDSKSALLTERKWKEDLDSTAENLKEDESLLVMVADVNGFKPVNDELGHDAGDRLLGHIGTAFKETFRRESDSMARGSRDDTLTFPGGIARLGGDEFAVFEKREPGKHAGHKRATDAEEIVPSQSERLNTKLKEILAGTEFEGFNVSVALGGVEYDPTIDKSPLDAFIRADAAMFEVKYAGKVADLTDTDIKKLRKIIPYLEGIGSRVEPWLKAAAYKDQQKD